MENLIFIGIGLLLLFIIISLIVSFIVQLILVKISRAKSVDSPHGLLPHLQAAILALGEAQNQINSLP